jgi:hypothetical protein
MSCSSSSSFTDPVIPILPERASLISPAGKIFDAEEIHDAMIVISKDASSKWHKWASA